MEACVVYWWFNQNQEHRRLPSHLPRAFSRTFCLSPFHMPPSVRGPEGKEKGERRAKPVSQSVSQSVSHDEIERGGLPSKQSPLRA